MLYDRLFSERPHPPLSSIVWWGGCKKWFFFFFCSIFATSAHLQINRAPSPALNIYLCCRCTLSPTTAPLSVACMTVEISRRWSLLGGVSGGRVSMHTNWWGKCFPASAVTLSTRLDFSIFFLSHQALLSLWKQKDSPDLLSFIFRGAETFKDT